ncbi:MAG: hypothetical protein CMP11_01950 [Zetaproteobacteria bacterium]|nr:hypothetical protein [Pseudobdellovibrionaceae bacterium]|tara:strand:+ start:100 stop:1017 length:918 start_codon:yes stop_codon:yes gene_type:complete
MSKIYQKKISTNLSDLHPYHQIKLSNNGFKKSDYFYGNFIQSIKVPSKFPDHSRSYNKGDPLNMIDWRAFARNDNLIIRERHEETNGTTFIYCDLNSSMNWPDNDTLQIIKKKNIKKSELALRVSLNVAFLHLKAGNNIELYLLFDNEQKSCKFSSPTEVLTLFKILTSKDFSYKEIFRTSRKKNNLNKKPIFSYIISDGLNNISSKIHRESKKSFFIHTLHSFEKNIEWLNEKKSYFDSFIEKKELLGSTLRRNNYYNNKLNEWSNNIKKNVFIKGGQYFQIQEDTSINIYLKKLNTVHKNAKK